MEEGRLSPLPKIYHDFTAFRRGITQRCPRGARGWLELEIPRLCVPDATVPSIGKHTMSVQTKASGTVVAFTAGASSHQLRHQLLLAAR